MPLCAQTGTEQAGVYQQQYLNSASTGNCSAAASLGNEWSTVLNTPFLNTVRLVQTLVGAPCSRNTRGVLRAC